MKPKFQNAFQVICLNIWIFLRKIFTQELNHFHRDLNHDLNLKLFLFEYELFPRAFCVPGSHALNLLILSITIKIHFNLQTPSTCFPLKWVHTKNGWQVIRIFGNKLLSVSCNIHDRL